MGETFAFVQIRTILTVLMSMYDLELVGEFPEPDYESIVVMPKGNNLVRYKRKSPKKVDPEYLNLKTAARKEMLERRNVKAKTKSSSSSKKHNYDGKQKLFTKEQVATHNTKHDLWIIVENRVYDITPYVELHQGGLEALLRKAGGEATKEIVGEERIARMDFTDDTHLDVEMLIISAGIRPRDELARQSGIQVGARGGIYVNEKMQTSDPSVFAIGEVALYNEGIYGLVAPGYEMAEVAVAQITGGDTCMAASIDMSTQLKLIGTEVASFGDPFVENNDIVAITYENKQRGVYKRINVAKDGSRLFGGILVGDASDYNMLFQIYYNAMKLTENPEDLILGSRGGDSILGSVLDLPDTAQICSCESVSKGAICNSLEEATCSDLKDIVKCTKATTGCGGCKPMVVDLVNETLKSLGKYSISSTQRI